jgi:subtilisin family serine protease
MKSPQWRRLGVGGAIAGLLLAAAPTAGAQAVQPSPTAPYVVVMAADPAVAYDGGVPGFAPAAPAPGEKIDPAAPEVARYVNHLESEQDEALAAAGVATDAKLATFTYALNGFSAALTAEQADRVAAQPGVVRVVRDQLRQLQTDTSPEFLGLDSRRGAWESGFTGEGVIVGVVDTGIWPEHPSFADDGTFPAPPADWMGGEVACEFGDTAHNPDDAPFDCNNKLIGARDMRIIYKDQNGPEVYNSARDYDGHGTHTASTAAGNRDVPATLYGIPRGTVSGIAPRAHVAMYSACGAEGCFSGDTAAAIDQAVADGVDVLNFSIGGGAGSLAPDDIAMLFARDAGVFVATSAGNEGPGASTVGSPATYPWVTAVGANTHPRTFENSVTLGNRRTYRGPSPTNGTDRLPLVDAADHGNPLCDPTVEFDPPVTDTIVLCTRGGGVLLIDKSLSVFEAGGAGMVLTDATEAQAPVLVTHWVPSVHLEFADGEQVRAYIDAAGSGARARIGVARAVETEDSVMASFSSRGPNVVSPSVIKPDVTAPGVDVLAGYTPTPLSSLGGQLFFLVSGTSMASPHVAGVFALIRQAHPDWTPAMAQSAVMTTARQGVVKEDGQTRADPFDIGAGHLDPGQIANRPGSVFNPGLVYDAGFNDYLGYLCDADPSAFEDPAATCAALEAAGIPTTVENLNYPSIGAAEVAGVAEVQRTITNVTDRTVRWSALVRPPAGFDVRVSPRSVRLAPGESAEVTLTITNRNAPFEEWRFGRLTWAGSGYEVTSPIAVRGVGIAAPAEISGTGTTGEASIGVQFGYDGAYTATAHGLAPQVGVAGSVDQDPDQTFDPADPTGTTAHEFTVAGDAHLRVALNTADLTPADPSIDIDLYLYNQDGEEVASSTNGGTDEVIDLSLPADGTYTLYVHGWQTLGAAVDYNLRTWQVSQDPGTTLTVTDAPAAATTGGTGTVEVAWSGLDAGTSYLGAVSHTGPDGLLGQTLVAVTTG